MPQSVAEFRTAAKTTMAVRLAESRTMIAESAAANGIDRAGHEFTARINFSAFFDSGVIICLASGLTVERTLALVAELAEPKTLERYIREILILEPKETTSAVQ